MRIKFLLVLIGVLGLSCSPQKRIARIAKKYNLFAVDTVYFRDTVYLPAKTFNTVTFVDTFGRFSYKNDNIQYQGVIVKDTVFIDITTPADTIYIAKNIPTSKIEIKPEKKEKLPFWSWLFFFLFGYVAINYIIQKVKSANKST